MDDITDLGCQNPLGNSKPHRGGVRPNETLDGAFPFSAAQPRKAGDIKPV
jgi:hypothetical protein